MPRRREWRGPGQRLAAASSACERPAERVVAVDRGAFGARPAGELDRLARPDPLGRLGSRPPRGRPGRRSHAGAARSRRRARAACERLPAARRVRGGLRAARRPAVSGARPPPPSRRRSRLDRRPARPRRARAERAPQESRAAPGPPRERDAGLAAVGPARSSFEISTSTHAVDSGWPACRLERLPHRRLRSFAVPVSSRA